MNRPLGHLRPVEIAGLVFVVVTGLVGMLVYTSMGWLPPAGLNKGEVAFWQTTFAFAGALVAILGAYISLSKYFDQKAESNRAALIEAKKPFLEKRQAVYEEFLEITSILANNGPDTDNWKGNEKRFWEIYWGVLRLVADDDVMTQADGCKTLVWGLPQGHYSPEQLRSATGELANACRKSMGFVWTDPR